MNQNRKVSIPRSRDSNHHKSERVLPRSVRIKKYNNNSMKTTNKSESITKSITSHKTQNELTTTNSISFQIDCNQIDKESLEIIKTNESISKENTHKELLQNMQSKGVFNPMASLDNKINDKRLKQQEYMNQLQEQIQIRNKIRHEQAQLASRSNAKINDSSINQYWMNKQQFNFEDNNAQKNEMIPSITGSRRAYVHNRIDVIHIKS